MRSRGVLVAIVISVLMISGCLTAQYKEYKFEFTGKNSGILTITYRNICSQRYDDEITAREELESDFEELINTYLDGNQLESEFPDAKLISKRLFEENNELCGEIIFGFDDISNVNLYKYEKKAPFMFYISSINESYFDSNGDIGPTYFPVIYWDRKQTLLELTTLIVEPEEDCISMLNIWKEKTVNQ